MGGAKTKIRRFGTSVCPYVHELTIENRVLEKPYLKYLKYFKIP